MQHAGTGWNRVRGMGAMHWLGSFRSLKGLASMSFKSSLERCCLLRAFLFVPCDHILQKGSSRFIFLDMSCLCLDIFADEKEQHLKADKVNRIKWRQESPTGLEYQRLTLLPFPHVTSPWVILGVLGGTRSIWDYWSVNIVFEKRKLQLATGKYDWIRGLDTLSWTQVNIKTSSSTFSQWRRTVGLLTGVQNQ